MLPLFRRTQLHFRAHGVQIIRGRNNWKKQRQQTIERSDEPALWGRFAYGSIGQAPTPPATNRASQQQLHQRFRRLRGVPKYPLGRDSTNDTVENSVKPPAAKPRSLFQAGCQAGVFTPVI